MYTLVFFIKMFQQDVTWHVWDIDCHGSEFVWTRFPIYVFLIKIIFIGMASLMARYGMSGSKNECFDVIKVISPQVDIDE